MPLEEHDVSAQSSLQAAADAQAVDPDAKFCTFQEGAYALLESWALLKDTDQQL